MKKLKNMKTTTKVLLMILAGVLIVGGIIFYQYSTMFEYMYLSTVK